TSGWPSELSDVRSTGVLRDSSYIDYFLFSRLLETPLPPLAVGRPAWDNHLLYLVRSQRAPLVDATRSITVVHQNHDYVAGRGVTTDNTKGAEVERNRALVGGRALTLLDATHEFVDGRVHVLFRAANVRRRLRTEQLLHPAAGKLLRPV